MKQDLEDCLVKMVLVAPQETEEQKVSKVNEDILVRLAHQEEPLGNEGQRDPQDQLESQASQEYLVFLDELGNWGKLEDQVKRETRETRGTKENLVKWG